MTARLDSTQEMADSESKAVLNERHLDSKVANLTSRFQCGQSGKELESRFAEISVRLEAEQADLVESEYPHGHAHTRNPGPCVVLGGFNLNTGDHVEHSSVTHTTRGIVQGCPGLRRWHGAGGCQATSFVSRRVNLAKL